MTATFPALRPVTSPPRAGRRAWFGLAVLFLPTLIVAVDNTVLGFALPAISAALAPSATQLLWLVDIYPLVLAGLLVTMGTLGDRIGRRRTLMIGVSGFGAVSLAASFAPDAVYLVGARALLGLFGAMLMPATLALLRTLFVDRVQRRLAVAIWATGFAAGAALGPIVGGVLLEHFRWGSVFLMNVPVMLALLVLAPLVLRESRVAVPGRLDPIGVLLSLLAMVPSVLAIKLLAHDGPTGTAGLALLVGVVAGVLFVRRARAKLAAGEEPLLDVTLFSSPVLRLSALANASTMFALTGLLFFSSQYLMLVLDLSPLAAGEVLLPGFVMTMLAGLVASRLARYFSLRTLVPAGLLLAAAGFLLCLGLGGDHGVIVLAGASVLVGTGIGLSETITNDAILTAAPANRAGSASAVSETAYEIGAVLGTAVLGSVLTAVYRSAVEVPASVAPLDADAARETLGGAVATVGNVSGGAAETLLASAQAAFVDGVGVTALVGAVVMVAVAVTVVVGLRSR
ncbi:MAG: transporter, family, multidrug resistance protein [Pseudonocardiales bacterium]|uniref:MFS transporter n=1 Tax=Pseudonocardia sp. TaxID=60912 RepID=UPI00261417B5|nr:MFS transporter [Pseudonocardia sp.]MCW2717507.1 transporter [Pseudonocardia sp.]MDT7710704.1 transporter, family, multidrug resistance protein [Pseudonocardiales bacterium]